jgi:hypothetical protein
MSARNDYAGDDTLEEARFRGNCKHSGFGEYDNLTGYLTRTYTVEWEDRQGTRWRKTCQVINLGRPDRGIPVDPDGAMEAEEWVDDEGQPAKALTHAKQGETLARLVAALQRRGPCGTVQLAAAINRTGAAIRNTLLRRSDLFVCLERGTRGRGRARESLWGLVGIHDKEAA